MKWLDAGPPQQPVPPRIISMIPVVHRMKIWLLTISKYMICSHLPSFAALCILLTLSVSPKKLVTFKAHPARCASRACADPHAHLSLQVSFRLPFFGKELLLSSRYSQMMLSASHPPSLPTNQWLFLYSAFVLSVCLVSMLYMFSLSLDYKLPKGTHILAT